MKPTSLPHCTWILYHQMLPGKPYIPCVCVCVCVTQSCSTLCDPMDCSPASSSVHGILQAGILECVAIPFSRESSWPRDQTRVSHFAGRFFTFWATSSLLQRIFLTQGSNPGITLCRQVLYLLSHQGGPCTPYSAEFDFQGDTWSSALQAAPPHWQST